MRLRFEQYLQRLEKCPKSRYHALPEDSHAPSKRRLFAHRWWSSIRDPVPIEIAEHVVESDHDVHHRSLEPANMLLGVTFDRLVIVIMRIGWLSREERVLAACDPFLVNHFDPPGVCRAVVF